MAQSNGPTRTGTDDLDPTLADTVADAARDRIEHFGHQAEQVVSKAQDMVRQFRPTVERSLKDQPMTTLAGAALVGFILGSLWKR
jgi:ElaB/YqjD/DUF883 family membrane-anchored ribosome-binding protein